MLIDSEIFTEVNPTQESPALDSDLDSVRSVQSVQTQSAQKQSVQTHVVPDAVPAMALLDASSLNTVLSMLEVIDSAEELALLETLTLEQKRQVWDATPEFIRNRLKQLRSKTTPEVRGTEPAFATYPLSNLPEAMAEAIDFAAQVEPVESVELAEQGESETDAVDLGLLENSPEPASESLDFVSPAKLATGDWVVLQAKPQLGPAELMAIWEVVEIAGQSARIVASKLGVRTYPVAWMLPYPKPIGYVEPEF